MALPFPNVTVLNHPLVQHKLTLLRRKETSTSEFRQLMRELSLLMAYEVTRDLVTGTVAIETPMEAMQAPLLSGKKLCFLSILRAGNGMLEGMLDLVPSARVGHIGLYRDPATLVPVAIRRGGTHQHQADRCDQPRTIPPSKLHRFLL